jgi:hypothetical protein
MTTYTITQRARIEYTPSPRTIRRRLERAGYTHVNGWVTREQAALVAEWIEAVSPAVKRIAAEPPAPRGRPRKLVAQG